ncbi:Beta-galactosidase C-terminal domain [Bacillus glycinifermentans]|nr:Beta-galactosidase C-terminal domain [Bacillus glycinifermentans]MEC3606762.1 Beta-galactosidase C-terminal domain [Bacillus glycinifermentans]
MDGKGGEVTLHKNAVDLIANKREAAGRLTIGPYQYRIILFPDM